MAYNIVKHRRGTTKEWLEVDLIPEDGELVIEECVDGTRKCKIGDGCLKFSKLPYIDDAVRAKLADSIKVLTAEASELKAEILTTFDKQAEIINADIVQSVEGLHNDLQSVKTELLNKVDSSIEKEVLIRESQIKALEDATYKVDEIVEGTIQPNISRLNTEVKQLQEEVVEQNKNIHTSEVTLFTYLANVKKDLQAVDEELANLINSIDDRETNFSEDITAKFTLLLEKYESLEKADVSLINKIIEISNTAINTDAKHDLEIATIKDTCSKERSEIYKELSNLKSSQQELDEAQTNALLTYVTDIYTELAELVDCDIQIINKVFEVRASLMASLAATDKKLTDEIVGLESSHAKDINELRQSLIADIDEKINSLSTELHDTAQTLLINIETLRSAANLLINSNREDISAVKQSIQNLNDYVSTDITQAIADTNRAIAIHSDRINNLMALPDGSTTADAELIDIRRGYEKNYQSAGECVRAIDKKVTDLIEDLPDYIPDNAVDGLLYENNQLWLTSNNTPVGDPVTITGGSGGSGGGSYSTVSVKNSLPSTTFTEAKGNDVYIKFVYTSIKDDQETGDGTVYITINGEDIEALSGGSVQHGQIKQINLNEYLSVGLNTIVVKCTDSYGVSGYLRYSIRIVELSIDLDPAFNKYNIFDSTLLLPYIIKGQIKKTLYLQLTDEDNTLIYDYSQEYSSSAHNESDSHTIDLQKYGCTHGIYTVKMYLTATLDNDESFPSNIIEFDIMYVEQNNDRPLLLSSCETTRIDQGDPVTIPFMIYDQTKSGIERDINVKTSIYTVVNGLPVEYTTKDMNIISGKVATWNTKDYFDTSASIPEDYDADPLTEGTQRVIIFEISYDYNYFGETRTLKRQQQIVVDLVSLNLKPVTNNLSLYLSATGRSNDDANLDAWTYGDITTDFSGFNWKSDGWFKDNDSTQDSYLRLVGEANAIINYNPFDVDFSATGHLGKTLEFDFMIRDVNDRNAVVIDCIDSAGRGFKVTPDTATLQSKGTNISCRYKEKERVNVVITVEPKSVSTRFVSVYLDGVLSGVQSYSNDDSFAQVNSVPIKLGSTGCGIDIYTIRIYDRALSTNEVLKNYISKAPSTSAKEQLLTENYFAKRNTNNIITDYNSEYKITYEEAKALGNIPIITFTGKMPEFKGNKRKNSVYFKFEDPTNTSPTDKDLCYYADANDGKGLLMSEIDVQGTSSAGYVRKNWKIKFADKYRHIKDAIATKTFCIKVDYAEATGTHNTGTANYVETLYDKKIINAGTDYVEYGDGFIPPQRTDDKIRTTIQGFPCLIFERADENSDYVFSSKGNFNYDKGSKETFGFTGTYDELYEPESWEFCNNTSGACNFLSELPADWRDDFEPRYTSKLSNTYDEEEKEYINAWDRIEDLIKKETAEGSSLTEAEQEELVELQETTIADFKVVHDWVVSTATEEPIMGVDEDGKPIVIGSQAIDFSKAPLFETPIQIGNEIFDKDSKEYRLAKFKNEFENYFNLHYTLIYYVFTFFALMVDQRAKNLFLTRWKDDNGNFKWYPYFYDNDTIFGINNVGALTFDYYHEDSGINGTIGTMKVYNGQSSTLWNNFRESFALEIQQTYQNLRTDGKIDYDKLLKCYITDGSDKWSAAIYNEDAEYKYISMARPHENNKGEIVSDKSNINQVRGKAEHHLRYFLDSRLKYCDSKWSAGNYINSENNILLRFNNIIDVEATDDDSLTEAEVYDLNSHSLNITPYSTMYVGVSFASGTPQRQLVSAGNTHKFSFGSNFNDTEVSIYGADELASIGSIAPYRCSYVKVNAASKLTELKIGHRAANYDNPNLGFVSIGAKRLLRLVDVRNCSGLGVKEVNDAIQRDLDLSECPNIEHIYTKGTNLASVSLPDGGHIKTLQLPASIESITIKNQPYLTDSGFSVDSYNNLTTIIVENCPAIDTGALLENCLAIVESKPINERYPLSVSLTGLTKNKWSFNDVTFIKSLFPKKDANGNLIGGIVDPTNSKKDATISGTCYIETLTGSDYKEIKEHYPALNIEFGTLTSEVTFMDTSEDDDKVFAGPFTVTGKDSTPCEVSIELLNSLATPTWPGNQAFSYEFVGWSENKQIKKELEDVTNELVDYEKDKFLRDEYPDAFNGSSTKGIVGDRFLYPVFKAVRKTYPVTFINPTAPTNEQILQIVDVPYGHDAKYTGPDPRKLDSSKPENYEFYSWLPGTTNITMPRTCKAQFKLTEKFNPWYEITLGDLLDCKDTAGNSYDGYTIDELNDTMIITECNNRFNPAILVPSTFDINDSTYTVVGIGGSKNGFSGHSNIEELKLPETLISLYNRAFSGCYNLNSLNLPESVININKEAFQGCSKLTSLYIPKNVSSISDAAFASCYGLTSITIAKDNNNFSVKNDCLIDNNKKRLLQGISTSTIPDYGIITSLGQSCFSDINISFVNIPEGIITIPQNAFSRCGSLTDVTLPNSVTTLDAMCFGWCGALTEITLTKNITDINNYAFYSSSLKNIVIPASVNKILDRAFGDNKSLETVTFETKKDAAGKIVAPSIDKNAFAESNPDITIVFNVPWSKDYDYNYYDKVLVDGVETSVKIDPTGWGASKFIINYDCEV